MWPHYLTALCWPAKFAEILFRLLSCYEEWLNRLFKAYFSLVNTNFHYKIVSSCCFWLCFLSARINAHFEVLFSYNQPATFKTWCFNILNPWFYKWHNAPNWACYLCSVYSFQSLSKQCIGPLCNTYPTDSDQCLYQYMLKTILFLYLLAEKKKKNQ